MTDDEINKIAKRTADEVFHQLGKAVTVVFVVWLISKLAEPWLGPLTH